MPSAYEFDSTLGLIKGPTSYTSTDWIELNIYPTIGMRYEIGFGNKLKDNAYDSRYGGYYQFGQFEQNFMYKTV